MIRRIATVTAGVYALIGAARTAVTLWPARDELRRLVDDATPQARAGIAVAAMLDAALWPTSSSWPHGWPLDHDAHELDRRRGQ